MTINNDIIRTLRQMKIITETETVLSEGDLFVAQDVLSGAKRIVQIPSNLTEGKRLLKG